MIFAPILRLLPWLILAAIVLHVTGIYPVETLLSDVVALLMRPINWLIDLIVDAIFDRFSG